LEFRKHTLDNGLEIVAECADQAYSTALGFFVKTGARDESAEVAGVSHFLEHMLFKGTPRRSAEDVNREFDEMGAHYNAFTNEESTVYYAAVLPEYQAAAVELLADILRPALREEDFDTEKQVILEEIHMYEDQPPFGADEKCRALLFGSHPLGMSVLGTEESVSQLPVAAMREYFRRRYSPGNIVLVGTGRIDFDAFVATARKCCGEWEPLDGGRSQPAPEMFRGFQVLRKETSTQQYAVQLSGGPTALDVDRYPAKLLTTVLGDDTGSRLYWELVDPGLAEQASLGHYEYEGAGLFMTYLACDPQFAAENLQKILDVYRDAERCGITIEELTQAKNKVSSRVVLSGERPRGRLFAVGGDWVHRRQYRSIRDDLQAVAAITRDDVLAVLDRYSLTESAIVTIGPVEEVEPPA
jgi:predicted Zn-dependent peptidase